MEKRKYILLTFLISLCSCDSTNFLTSSNSNVSNDPSSDSSVSEIVSDETSSDNVSSSESVKDDSNLLDKWPEQDCYKFTYEILGNDVMPLGAWCAPTGNYNTYAQYRLLKESGLNSVYGLYETMSGNSSEVFKALEHAYENDIVYLVRDSSIAAHAEDEEDFVNYMNQFMEYSSYGGTLIADEPGVKMFNNYTTARKLFRKYYSKKAFYINLFPTYASMEQLENGTIGGTNTMNLTYEQYLDNYLKTVQPQFLSYDYYGQNNAFPNVASGYFEQLYISSIYANKYKIPFWPFIQACQFGGKSRVPTEIDIYWQVNVSLAYGAKGIQYFCYFQPTEMSSQGYEGSYIDKNGQKTVIYDYCQNINKQIGRMDEVLMNSTLLNQMVYGSSSPAPINQDNIVTSFREVSKITTNNDLLVGCFDYEGKTVLYAVNNSLTNNCSANISFNKNVEASLYYMFEDKYFSGKDLTINLTSGQGVLIELTNYK